MLKLVIKSIYSLRHSCWCNTPMMVKQGATTLCLENVSADNGADVSKLFSAISKVYMLKNEHELDMVTAVNGSGPAYIFEWSRIMSEYLIDKGLTQELAEDIVKQTFLGSSHLMTQASESLEELRNNVTSKKGVTYEALEIFKQADLTKITHSALDRAYERGQEILRDYN